MSKAKPVFCGHLKYINGGNYKKAQKCKFLSELYILQEIDKPQISIMLLFYYSKMFSHIYVWYNLVHLDTVWGSSEDAQ